MELPQYVASNASPVVEPQFMEAAPTGMVMLGNMESSPHVVNTPGNMEPPPHVVGTPGYMEARPDMVDMPQHNGAPPPTVVMPKYMQTPHPMIAPPHYVATSPPVVVTTQPRVIPPEPAYRDYLMWSIFNLFCCLLLGFVALRHSIKARAAIHRRDSFSASNYSHSALGWNVLATVVGTCINIGWSAYLIYYYVTRSKHY